MYDNLNIIDNNRKVIIARKPNKYELEPSRISMYLEQQDRYINQPPTKFDPINNIYNLSFIFNITLFKRAFTA